MRAETDVDDQLPCQLPWSSTFEVGVPELDADHRSMVALINEACAAFAAGEGRQLIERLGRLCVLAAEHFEREEAVLEQLPGPELRASHRREHRHRLTQLETLREQCRQNDGRPPGIEVSDELIDWFVRQAIGQDARIKAYFG